MSIIIYLLVGLAKIFMLLILLEGLAIVLIGGYVVLKYYMDEVEACTKKHIK